MVVVRYIALVFALSLVVACATNQTNSSFDSQARVYISEFYQDEMPLTKGETVYRRSKFHGQSKEVYIVINGDTITLKEAQDKSIVTQISKALKAEPALSYEQTKSKLRLTTVEVDSTEFEKYKNLVTQIQIAILLDHTKRRQGDYRLNIVADGESHEYSVSSSTGYNLTLMNNYDSKIVELFLKLRDELLSFE